VAVSLISASQVGCGAPDIVKPSDDPSAELIGVTGEKIYGKPSTYWPLRFGVDAPFVNVCWEPSAFSSPAFANIRFWVEDAIRSNWVRHGRINLVDVNGANLWQQCTTNQAGIHAWIRHFNSPNCGGSNTGTGTDHDGVNGAVGSPPGGGIGFPDCDPATTCGPGGASSQEVCVKRIALHESGHGIGWYHEEQRGAGLPDCNPGNNTPPILGGQKYGAFNELGVMSDCDGPAGAAGIMNLNSLDIAAVQRAYGRRQRGSLISPNGRCVHAFGTPSGEEPFMWDCHEWADQQEWDFTFGNGTFTLKGTSLCLQGSTSARATTATCNPSSTAQQFSFRNTFIRGYGKCMDLAGGNTNGGGVQAWDCGALGGGNQKWFITRAAVPEIRFGGASSSTKCLTAPSSGSGQLTVTTCNGSNLQRFRLANTDQQIVSDAFPSLCLDIQSELDSSYMSGVGGPANGQIVQLHACSAGQYNEKWNFSGEIASSLPIIGATACLAREHYWNQSSKLTLANCNGGIEQTFDYYPL
jgi:hypothetical protein